MIVTIEGDLANKADHAALIEAMHKNRAQQFNKRHGWDVYVSNTGWEIDEFDAENPLYMISLGDKGEYRGSLRLLPTTGPNMLRDVFPQLLWVGGRNEGDRIESATIWEVSRICAVQGVGSFVLRELIAGVYEICKVAGLTQIVAVFDERLYRIMRTFLRIEIIGTPQVIGEIKCYAGVFEFTEHELQTFKERYGFGSVLEMAL